MIRRNTSREAGFTLIELTIASSVFAIVLMIALAGFVQIGRMYYRGLSAARTQEAARAVIDDVSREIQFSSNSVLTASSNGIDIDTYCVGNRRYTFVLHKRMTKNPSTSRESQHVLRRDFTGAAAAGCGPATPPELAAAEDLLSDNMRLAKFSVTSVPGSNDKLWAVSVKVAYGEDDLFEGFSLLAADPMGDSTNVKCLGKTSSGGQFCAVSEVSTVVYRRLR